MRRLIAVVATALVAVGGLALSPTQQPAEAHTVQQRDAAWSAFIAAYWDPAKQYFFTYSDRTVHSEHAVGPENGLYTDYWWEAQLWSMTMDRYAATGDPDARAKIDQIYDGFREAYPDFSANDWNDDIGWWAAGAVRAYELTGEQRFLDAAEDFAGFISQYEDTTYGGGIWWKNDILDGEHNEKNVATNGTAVQTLLRLYAATGDTNYRAQAFRIYAWLEANFDRDGRIRDNISHDGEWKDYDFTYDQGQFAGAALQMYLATGDRADLSRATRAVDWAVQNLTVSGVFRDEGSADGAGFKAILTRVMRLLVDDAHQTRYEAVLTANASQAAAHRNAAGLGGTDWSSTPPDSAVQSIVAAGSVAVQQQARPDGSAAVVEGTRSYPAENVVTTGIPSASTLAGFTGRGYLDWSGAAGSALTVPVNSSRAGERTLHLRYQAAADATRVVAAGDASVVVALPATPPGAWGDAAVTVTLPVGFTAVRIGVDGGGAGAIALDGVTLDR